MPTWADLQDQLDRIEPEEQGNFISEQLKNGADQISRGYNRNVLYYASGFLQKPQAGIFASINMEDINGIMSGVHGLDFDKGLLLILHTPGGLAEAAQTIVEYLRSKFSEIDVLVSTYAMSAGTMIVLGCDQIIMGRQSQLGPTDPQIMFENRAFSAHSIVEQFQEAKIQIASNPVLAHAWAPVLRSFGPALLQEARKSISYGQNLVQGWLQSYMFSGQPNSKSLAKKVAAHFGGDQHGSHGRRINRAEVRSQKLQVLDLENDQNLQNDIMTLYHLSTLGFERSPAVKLVVSNNRRLWIKNL